MAQPDAAGARQRYSDHTLLVRFVDRDAALAAARETPAILRAVDAKVTWVGRHVPGLAIVELETPQFLDVARELLASRDDVLRVDRDPMTYPLIEPNDTHYPTQHTYLKHVGFPDAWDTTTSSNQLIAILDTGARFTLPEIAQNIERNFGEPATPNGIDDDANGYVDDHWGSEFLPKGDAESTFPHPLDVWEHGTGVLSILGAATNNANAIAGALWQCRIVPVKILGALGNSTASNAIQGMEYAYDRGARIMNCSWYTPLFVAALKDQMNTMDDVLFVVAAGNFWFDLDGSATCFPVYPAMWSIDNSLVVGGCEGEQAERWQDEVVIPDCGTAGYMHPGTCWGAQSVHLFAPAQGILNVNYSGGVDFSDHGTSLSAPLVTAAAAMVRDLHPTWTPNHIRQHLMATGDAFPGLAGYCVSGKRLNVWRAIQ